MTTPATQLNALLPPRLQPGVSKSFTEEVERLTNCGWTIDSIHQHIVTRANADTGPGAVIYMLRNMPDTPPPAAQPTPTPRHLGHQPCPDGHGDRCQPCYCDPTRGPVHHRTSRHTINMVRLASLIATMKQGGVVYHTPPDTLTGNARCTCPDPEHTMALVATSNPITPGDCQLHTIWQRHTENQGDLPPW